MRAFTLLRALIATKLGACAFCIRLSLVMSLASWAVFAVLQLWIPASIVTTWAFVPALGFTALFASHLVAYAVRVVVAYRGAVAPTSAAQEKSRRRFLAASAQAIGLALLPTAVASVVWSSAAGRADCPRPADCLSGCCCQRCKTRLKKCDPAYQSCTYLCAASCVG